MEDSSRLWPALGVVTAIATLPTAYLILRYAPSPVEIAAAALGVLLAALATFGYLGSKRGSAATFVAIALVLPYLLLATVASAGLERASSELGSIFGGDDEPSMFEEDDEPAFDEDLFEGSDGTTDEFSGLSDDPDDWKSELGKCLTDEGDEVDCTGSEAKFQIRLVVDDDSLCDEAEYDGDVFYEEEQETIQYCTSTSIDPSQEP